MIVYVYTLGSDVFEDCSAGASFPLSFAMSLPRGNIVLPWRTVVFPRGIVVFSRGVVVLPRGVMVLSGRVIVLSRRIALPRGIIVSSRRIIALPRGVILLSGGANWSYNNVYPGCGDSGRITSGGERDLSVIAGSSSGSRGET